MIFDLTEEQRLLVESARAFARHELAPKAADWDRDHHFPEEVIRAAAEQGYLGLYIAEEDGGLGLPLISISEPTRLRRIWDFGLRLKKKTVVTRPH
ncbi:acyl-CoA dehydrogenase family protein, partial [Pseudomonas aeruginosa]|uniref:acyl-CoA dehydrogenase family protein n=1 Tax=Pseudomonas aeruginosa TaxID=287 RepID=UPI0020B153CC